MEKEIKESKSNFSTSSDNFNQYSENNNRKLLLSAFTSACDEANRLDLDAFSQVLTTISNNMFKEKNLKYYENSNQMWE